MTDSDLTVVPSCPRYTSVCKRIVLMSESVVVVVDCRRWMKSKDWIPSEWIIKICFILYVVNHYKPYTNLGLFMYLVVSILAVISNFEP